MAITFTYAEATNLAVVIEGTEGTPADEADFVHFDRTVGTSNSSIPGADVLGGLGDCATDWFDVQGDGWSHDGVADEYDCDGSQASSSLLIENSILTIGVTYKVTYTVKNWTENGAGDWIRAICGLTGFGTARYANGTYTEFITCGGDTHFRTQAGADFIGSVTDITIEPVGVSGAELKAATAVGADTDLTLTYPVRPVEHKALRLAITTAQNGGAAVSGDETVDIFGTTAVWQKLTGASASGQKVVPIADLTHNYQVGDTVILIDISAPGTYETDTIASIAEGVSITLTNNNTNSYATGDIVGIYQTEQIDTHTPDFGTVWTTVPYGQIAILTFTGYDGTNTAKVDQPIWGVIWDYGNGQHQIDAKFNIGNGGTSTYFKSTSKRVAITVAYLCVRNLATLNLLTSQWSIYWSSTGASPLTDGGSTFISDGSYIGFRFSGDGREVAMYGICTLVNTYLNQETAHLTSSISWKNAASSLTNVHIKNIYYGFRIDASLTSNNVSMEDCYFGIYSNPGGPAISTKSSWTGTTIDVGVGGIAGNVLSLIDPITTISSLILFAAAAVAREQRTCNIHVTIEGGGAIADTATVACTRANVVTESAKFYKCITAHTSGTFATDLAAGKWVEITDATILDAAPAWLTTTDYVSAEAEFSVNPTSGDIAEQTLTYKTWIGTSELETKYLHDFTLSETGYETLIKNNITVDTPIVWNLKMKAQKQPPAPWQEGMM